MSEPFIRRALSRMRLVAFSLIVVLAGQASLGAGLVAASPTASAAVAAHGHASIDAGLLEELDNALWRARLDSYAPGLSVAIVAADGRVWERGSGLDRYGAPVSARTPQTIASITKTFTATIVMQLVEEGLIELDVLASRHLPKVRLVRHVTVRQLLAHTSGISDLYGPAKDKLKHAWAMAISSNDVLGPIGPAWFPAGKGYGYSNTNYYLLGHIIEVVTGQSFNEVLAERISGPLELERTRLLTADDAQLPAAWSTAFWTSGAMVATPGELARFGHALYGGGLVSDKSLAQMVNFGGGHRYGLGTQLVPLGSRAVPGHSGLLYATTSLLVHLPAERVTIAIFGTAPNTNLEAALVHRYGKRSLLELALTLGR